MIVVGDTCVTSNFEKNTSPDIAVKSSSTLKSGYWSTFDALLMVILSPQIQTLPSSFNIGTMGAAQSVNSTFSSTPIDPSL